MDECFLFFSDVKRCHDEAEMLHGRLVGLSRSYDVHLHSVQEVSKSRTLGQPFYRLSSL